MTVMTHTRQNQIYIVQRRLLKVLWLVGLFLVMVIITLPAAWIVLSSLRPNVEILAKPAVWVPTQITLDHFRDIFNPNKGGGGAPVWYYFRNSLIISLTSTVIAILIGMSGGYAFARYAFRHKDRYFLWFMLSRAVPGIALSLPLFFIYGKLGIIDTKFSMILTYTVFNIPFTIWLIDGFFRQVPIELSQAAQVDGCTPWQAFWKIDFPLAKSGIAAAAIFAFLTSWNDFALASHLTRSTNSRTLPVGLLDFMSEFTFDWGGMCAMAVIILVPAFALTFLVQKHLVSGLTFGGVKG